MLQYRGFSLPRNLVSLSPQWHRRKPASRCQHDDLIMMPPRRVGGASASQAEGREFESRLPLQPEHLLARGRPSGGPLAHAVP